MPIPTDETCSGRILSSAGILVRQGAEWLLTGQRRDSESAGPVQSELSPVLDRQLHAEHNCPLDNCTSSYAPQRAGPEQRSNGCAFFGQDRPPGSYHDRTRTGKQAMALQTHQRLMG